MRDRLIAAAVLIALLIVSWVIVATTECTAGQKIGSKILVQGC
jgi:hypothetical protein